MNTLDANERQELVDMLEEAREHLHEAIESVEYYVRVTGDINAREYLLAPLKIHADRECEYVSHDLSLDDLIDRVKEGGPLAQDWDYLDEDDDELDRDDYCD